MILTGTFFLQIWWYMLLLFHHIGLLRYPWQRIYQSTHMAAVSGWFRKWWGNCHMIGGVSMQRSSVGFLKRSGIWDKACFIGSFFAVESSKWLIPLKNMTKTDNFWGSYRIHCFWPIYEYFYLVWKYSSLLIIIFYYVCLITVQVCAFFYWN